MPQVPIIMPQLGESIAEATIVSINVKPGEKVAADQEIIEVETNKAVMGVTTPCAGEIAKIDAQVKETYPIGAVLGYIEASEKDAARFRLRHSVRWPRKSLAGMTKKAGTAHISKSTKARCALPALARKTVCQVAVCQFPRRRKEQGFCRRASVREWRRCN
jgi:pyruvate/2-oxoglutarate dehydrogenase complex dihydrolipoamide acyltransferase (E2) component